MSRIPAEALDYATVVAEYFVQLRGAGLLLSPLDAELVSEWERRGLPVEVVCRGLRAGHEALRRDRPAGAGPPRALRALRGWVEAEWRAYREGRVGAGPAPGGEGAAARERLEAARRRLAEGAAACAGPGAPGGEARAEAYRAAAAGLPPAAGTLDEVERALRAADDLLIRRWLAALPAPERAALGPRCRLLAGDRPRRTHRAAHRAALRSHLADAARRAGILCLSGSV